MAVFPRRYGKSRGSDKAAVVALEAHVKYMEEQIEYYASLTTKTILDLNTRVEEQEKIIAELKEKLGEDENV